MPKTRLEAFSDGVLAIIITIRSVVHYLAAMPLAFLRPWMAMAVYLLVALRWLVPDRRIERALAKQETRT
jgi:uncharacterized membrane protein